MKTSINRNLLKRREIIKRLGSMGLIGLLGFSEKNTGSFPTRDNGMASNEQNQFFINDTTGIKTIGILGGLGPQATMDLEKHIHHAAQRMIPPLQNSGYPPMIVYYHRHPPVLLNKDFTPVLPIRPDPRLLEAAKRIGSMADFLLIPSNGVHMLQEEFEQAAGCKVLSIIDVTLEEVKKRKWRKVGVLGYKSPAVYTKRLIEMNIPFETIDEQLQTRLDVSIMKVMEGRDDNEDHSLVIQVMNELRNKNVNGIIPGCTEIPLLLRENINDPDMINPTKLLAEAAVRYSLS